MTILFQNESRDEYCCQLFSANRAAGDSRQPFQEVPGQPVEVIEDRIGGGQRFRRISVC
jgi:hypothetical protein